MSRVLVLGGTGTIGRGLVNALAAAGHDVVVGSRRGRAEGDRRAVRVDLRDRASLRAAAEPVDRVVVTMPLSDGRRDGFVAERDGTRNLLEAVAHRPELPIVKISEIGAGEHPEFFDLACKFEAEEAVRGSGHPFLVLRPPWVMEAWTHQLTTRLGVLVPLDRRPISWVSVRDLGSWVATAFERWDAVAGRTLTAQGPEALTYAEAGARYARAVGRRRIPLPTAAFALGAPVSPRLRTLAELFRFYADSDQGPRSAETHRLLGEPAVSFEQFLQTVEVAGVRVTTHE